LLRGNQPLNKSKGSPMAASDDFGEVYVSHPAAEGGYEEDFYFGANNQNQATSAPEAGEITVPPGQEGEDDIYSFDGAHRSNAQGTGDQIKSEEREEEEMEEDDEEDVKILLDIETVENRGGGRGAYAKMPAYGRGRPLLIIPGGGQRLSLQKTQQPQHLQNFQENSGRKNAFEIDIDSLDEKLWRKPGADITDYFNYGFNEATWRAYCEKQAQIRLEQSMKSKISVFEPPTDSGSKQPQSDLPLELQAMVGGGDSGGWKRGPARGRDDWRGGFDHRRRLRQDDAVIQINPTGGDAGDDMGRSTPDRIPDMMTMEDYGYGVVPPMGMPFPPMGFPPRFGDFPRDDRRRDEDRKRDREKRSPPAPRSPKREERDKERDRDREKRREERRRKDDYRDDYRERHDYRDRDEFRDDYRDRDEYRDREDYKEREEYKKSGSSSRDEEDRKRRRY